MRKYVLKRQNIDGFIELNPLPSSVIKLILNHKNNYVWNVFLIKQIKRGSFCIKINTHNTNNHKDDLFRNVHFI